MAESEDTSPPEFTEERPSAAEELAEITGRPASEFEVDEDEFPEFDELEEVPESEW